MQGEMTRGRSQVIWRYSPNALFRYNADSAWCKVTDVTMNKPIELQGGLLNALTDKLIYWNAINATGYPDPRTHPHKYEVGEPYWVRYDVWPTIFMCKKCKRMHYYQSVSNLKQFNENLRCKSCGLRDEMLTQISFAYVCPCGNIETLFVPKCDKNKDHPVCLRDVGNFQDSYWYCNACHQPIQRSAKDGLGIRNCSCGKPMRGIVLIDPRVYYSQTLAIVDIQPDILATWKDNENFSKLLEGAVFRIPAYKSSDIQNLSKQRIVKDGMSPEIVEMKKMLLSQGMDENVVDDLVNKSMEKSGIDPWRKYDENLKQCKEYYPGYDFVSCYQTVEYVFVRDEPSNISFTLSSLCEQAKISQNMEAFSHYNDALDMAYELGLINLAVVQELPILLAGIGYSRYFGSPIDFDGASNDAKLNTYAIREDGKIPLYVAKNSTEAFMYELDPWRVAAFLEINGVISVPDSVKSCEYLLRAWLVGISGRLRDSGESHLQLLSFEKERGVVVDLPSAFIFGVLHTMSHALKATAHQYVGIDQDSLSEYLFPLHLSGLLYASSHVKFTLGGIDAVFRSNLQQWLGSVRDFANSCSFDPVCADDGGACLACLYTKFGCNYFNRTLSRSFLFGGSIKGYQDEIIGYWSNEVTNLANEIQNNNATNNG
ncbi:MAG: hypothetical protein H6756_02595 [Candidatus Omnitrophica bacterium]|nr:hypothetical protein [Candidatus Omnitrophota bacterium]